MSQAVVGGEAVECSLEEEVEEEVERVVREVTPPPAHPQSQEVTDFIQRERVRAEVEASLASNEHSELLGRLNALRGSPLPVGGHQSQDDHDHDYGMRAPPSQADGT